MKKNQPYRVFHLSAKRAESASVNTLIFDDAWEGAEPGQFVMVWLPGVGEKPFCVAEAHPFTLIVAVAGDFSRALHAINLGEQVWARGPFGRGFEPLGDRHLLIGGGYGTAPLLFLARRLANCGQPVMACLGARHAAEILLAEAFRQVGCEVRAATDDGSLGEKGTVTRLAEMVMPEFKPKALYACGPLPMLTEVARLLQEKGLPGQLSFEAIMRCGIGLCGSCELDSAIRDVAGIPPGWLTCRDGPVFYMHSQTRSDG